jgi:bacterioferritin-associated ferredoxin
VIVCHCRAISDREIRRAVHGGATSLPEVARACGAGAGCGGCAAAVLDVLRSEVGARAARAGDPGPQDVAARR